jgi:sulfite reductase (NADPH) flavoprotein alpha-component
VREFFGGRRADAAQPFYQKLCVEQLPRYLDLSYSVLALGDSHYEHFCKFGIDLDNKLSALGAVRICGRVDCDVDLDEVFAQWKQDLCARLESIVAVRPARNSPSSSATTVETNCVPAPTFHDHGAAYSRENPFFAPLIEKRPLTRNVSSKQTIHLSFSIADSNLKYEAGDACGVVPQNDERLVREIIIALKFSPDAPVQLPKAGSASLCDALTHHLQITRLTRKMIEAYATIGNCQPLFDLLAPNRRCLRNTPTTAASST